jgi:hypothetical protein
MLWRWLRLVAAKVLQMAGGPGRRARKGVRAFAKGSSVRYASVLSRYAKTTTSIKKTNHLRSCYNSGALLNILLQYFLI